MPKAPPVSRNPEVVRRRILDAARSEFMACGYEAASTNRITRRFGGSKATLFRYFPGKTALLEAVVRDIAAGWRRAVRVEDLPTGEPAAWLVGFAQRSLDWILGDGPLFVGRLGITEGRRFPALEHVFDETAGRPMRRGLARRLRAWSASGLLSSPRPLADAEHFLDLLLAGAVSRCLYGLPRPSPARLARHVRRAVELFLNGCSRRQPLPTGAVARGGGARARRRRRRAVSSA